MVGLTALHINLSRLYFTIYISISSIISSDSQTKEKKKRETIGEIFSKLLVWLARAYDELVAPPAYWFQLPLDPVVEYDNGVPTGLSGYTT